LRRNASLVFAILAAAWALLVWALLTASEVPGMSIVSTLIPPALQPWQDKVGHAALFLVQALLLERAAVGRLGARRALLLAVGCCLALGLATELRQRGLPGRDADAADFGADVGGAVIYAGALLAKPGKKTGWVAAPPAP
jgi:VanZ family protein